MQLFAGELTNQNREYYKVNDKIPYLKGHVRTMSLIKKPVLWNCVLQVQLYIFLPDNIFEVFLQKQNHSLVPLTFCRYNVSTRHSRETLLQGNTGILAAFRKYRYFIAALKILKIGIHVLCYHIFRFNCPFLHNICMRDINLVD